MRQAETQSALSKKALAEALDVSVQTINGWMRDGLPSYEMSGLGRGSRRRMFDIVAAAEWFATTGKAKYVFRLDDKLPRRKDKPDPDADQDQAARMTVLEMADRMVDDAWSRYQASDHSLKLHTQEQWEHAVDTRRKLRNDHARSEQSLGGTMPVSEHDRILYESHSIVAQALRALAKKAAPLVANKSARDTYAILKRETDACQRGIAKGDIDQ